MIAASCRLDDDELAAQLERYRALAQHATEVDHEPGRVMVRFSDDPPADLLERTLEIERGCCPFLHIEYEPACRSLAIAVNDPEHLLELDAIAQAFAERLTTRSLPIAQALATSGSEPMSCCSSTVLETCCEPQAKEDCCGSATTESPARCGCR
jgi:hypothetical protein